MRFLLLTAVFAAVICIVATPAGASSRSQELHKQKARYYHAVGFLKAIKNARHNTFLSLSPATRLKWSAKVNQLIEIRDDAAKRIKHLQEPVLPSHYAGWMCIHNGPHPGAPGNPHEGSGYNGHYSGPLQMSRGWMGYPISDWNKLPMMQVFADAEKAAAKYGFSWSFMHGQWPNTYPPCSKYF